MPKRLTSEQTAAVESLQNAVTLVAAAGSGKTSVLVEHCLRLLQTGFSPHEILAVTFTNEAAQELKSRLLETLVSAGAEKELISKVETSRGFGTIHSFCYRVISQFGSELGLAAPRGVVDPFTFATRFTDFFDQWLESLDEPTLKELLRFYQHRELRDVLTSLYFRRHAARESQSLKLAGPGPGEEVAVKLLTSAEALLTALEKSFLESGIYAFDDLEHYALEILEKSVIARQALRAQIRRVLVDEFQDTSSKQWQILRLLVGEELKKLFLVGDPRQSIYSFRDADPSLFAAAEELFRHSGERTLELTYNFRSQPGLLARLNDLSLHLFPEISLSAMQTGQSPRPQQEEPLRVVWYGPEEKLKREELSQLEVESLGPHVLTALEKGSVALLFRNGDRIADFQTWFESRGISTRGRQGETLSESYVFEDLSHFFHALADPLDDFSLAAFLQSPLGGLTWSELHALNGLRAGEDRSGCLYDAVKENPPQRVQWFLELVESTQGLNAEKALTEAFRHAPEGYFAGSTLLSLLEPLHRESLSVFEASRRMRAWKKAAIWAEKPGRDREAKLSLLTVHAAKGLEFDTVFLVDLLRQTPSESPWVITKAGVPLGLRFSVGGERAVSSSYEALCEEKKLRQEAESKRILYVAATRAKENLVISLPRCREGIPKGSWAECLNDFLESREENKD